MLPDDLWQRRWDDLPSHQQVLWGGDGSALFAIQWRAVNPGATGSAPMDATAAYLRRVSDDPGAVLVRRPATRLAADYRLRNPGCSFAEVERWVMLRRSQ